MTSSQVLMDDLCTKLRRVGLPKDLVLPLVNSLSKQIMCEGPENVVRRLKTIKQAAVNHMAGVVPKFTWVRHNHFGPKGPWKPVWKMFLSSSHKQKKVAFNSMMVYASLILPEKTPPTSTQERKFLSSVEHDALELARRDADLTRFIGRSRCQNAVNLLAAVIDTSHRIGSLRKEASQTLRNVQPNPDVLTYLGRYYGTETPESIAKIERSLFSFLDSEVGYHFCKFPKVQKCLGEIGSMFHAMDNPFMSCGLSVDVDTGPISGSAIGVVGSSQEPGFKFRAFASPSLVLQCAQEGLKQTLLEVLKKCPWDCTHDQDEGVIQVQKWLRSGVTMFSVDLSDATNNFPLRLQSEVLQALGLPPEDLHLFNAVSLSPFKKTWGDHKTIAWDVGQPLGAAPSFPAFAITHAFVALMAEHTAGIKSPGSTFLILGDDFVTNHKGVHEAYRSILKELNCPISEDKCLVSGICAEFAGKVIFEDRVYHGYKYKDIDNRSFLPVIRTLGRQALSKQFLTEEQYRYAKLVQSLPEPFGLGFNPEGVPLAVRHERMLHLQHLVDLESQNPTSLASVSQIQNAVLYHGKHPVLQQLRRKTFSAPELRHTTPSQGVTSESPMQDRLSALIRGTNQLVSPVVVRGDPRPDPISGWTKVAEDRKAYVEMRMGLSTVVVTPVSIPDPGFGSRRRTVVSSPKDEIAAPPRGGYLTSDPVTVGESKVVQDQLTPAQFAQLSEQIKVSVEAGIRDSFRTSATDPQVLPVDAVKMPRPNY